MTQLIPDVDGVTSLIAERIVKSAKDGGAPSHEDLAERIAGVRIQTQITGASMLTLDLIDPEWELQTNGWLELNKEGLLQEIELEFPAKSGFFWRLCAVEGSNETSDANLTLTFEDRIIAYLREYWKPKHAPPKTTTRAQFVRDLVREVGQKGEPKIRFIAPGVNKVQPLEPTSEEKTEALETATAEAEGKQKKNKEPGLTKGSPITLHGKPASASQIAEANTLLSVAFKLGAPTVAKEALLFAGIAESKLSPSENTSGHSGVLQSSEGGSTEREAEQFLKGEGAFQAGGAIKLAASVTNPIEIAVKVEAPSVWPDNAYAKEAEYSTFLPDAKAILEAGGGTATSAEEATTDVGQLQRGTTENPDEDSWDCICRLAQQVNWRAFTDGNTFFYMTDPELIAQTPALYLDVPKNKVRRADEKSETEGAIIAGLHYNFDNTAFEYRKTHKVKGKSQRRSKAIKPTTPSEIQFDIICEPSEFTAGEVFVFENSGLINGRWIVSDATREYLKDPFTHITLVPPSAPLPEPRAAEKEGETKPQGVEGYVNPLSQIQGLTPERIDMGVDYSGSGNLLALGNGKVFYAAKPSGWPGPAGKDTGGFIGYTLSDGPFAGKHVYVAENIDLMVKTGDLIKSGQAIAKLNNASPNLETGWAAGTADSTLAASLNQQAPGDPGEWESAAGASFNRLLEKLGAPSGTKQSGGEHGKMPGGYP